MSDNDLVFFVTDDLGCRDLYQGRIYDTSFRELTVEQFLAAPRPIHPVTEDQFEMLEGAHEMGVDINIEVRE